VVDEGVVHNCGRTVRSGKRIAITLKLRSGRGDRDRKSVRSLPQVADDQVARTGCGIAWNRGGNKYSVRRYVDSATLTTDGYGVVAAGGGSGERAEDDQGSSRAI